MNIYIDLSKACDTIVHEIIISKREHYGVKGEASNPIRSHLYQRQQLVEFNGCLSDIRNIERNRCPTKILGLILFSIYINDLPSCLNMFKMIMYVDDTTLLCDINNDNDIETLINDELCKITNWLPANKLSLNVKKTKFMDFHSDRKHVVYPILSINDTVIKRADSDTFNFLGLHMWSQQITTIFIE